MFNISKRLQARALAVIKSTNTFYGERSKLTPTIFVTFSNFATVRFSLKCNEKLILLASDISNDVGKVHEHLCARIRKVGRAAGVAKCENALPNGGSQL